jgi:hypothetical protein
LGTLGASRLGGGVIVCFHPSLFSIEKEKPSQRLTSQMVVGLIAATLILVAIVAIWFRSTVGREQTVASNGLLIAQEVGYEVVNNFPHDREAFLQGLVWHNGFFESTGQLGRSWQSHRGFWHTDRMDVGKHL